MSAPSRTTVLIIEDDPMIALDIETALSDIGLTDLSVFATSDDAVRWLKRNCPDVAVLDVLLREGTSSDIAANLSERGIPFVVCCAGDVKIIDKAFADGIWVEKPFSEKALQTGVREALESYFG